jgi:hypothetical protein
VSTRDQWLPGPWDDEPDRVDFEAHGFECQIRRMVGGPSGFDPGHLCGYVVIPEGHPWHGVENEGAVDAEVHGGVTWAGPLDKGGPWLVGFDCAHAYDMRPGDVVFRRKANLPPLSEYETYRDLAFVRAEVESLAKQAATVAK